MKSKLSSKHKLQPELLALIEDAWSSVVKLIPAAADSPAVFEVVFNLAEKARLQGEVEGLRWAGDRALEQSDKLTI